MPFDSLSVVQLAKMLGNLDRWLAAAIAHAEKKSFDPAVLLSARLAPDQYPLYRQVQAACDAAKFAGARLTGKDAPKHADGEQSFAELRARIADVIAWLGELAPADYEGAESRVVALPFLQGKALSARDYLLQLAQPNFYFHATTAYAILRHNGVELGKSDYIGELPLRGL